jgi:cell division protein FtsB
MASSVQSAIGGLLRRPLKDSGIHLVTLTLGVLTLSLLYNFTNQVIQSARLEARRVELEESVTQLEAENFRLQGAVEYAESDAHIERMARERLNYAREGDIVVLPLIPVPTPVAPAAAEDTPDALPRPTPAPNWQGWWNAFTVSTQ